MIDLEGIPYPDDAPEPGACVRVEWPSETVARIVLDPPHKPKIAVFDRSLLTDLDAVLAGLEDDPKLHGLVITGCDPLTFCAGADIETVARLEDPELACKLVAEVQKLFQRIHVLGTRRANPIMTVAAVGGPVPGGACELALACRRIVLADDPKSRIGLPEVLLGILPAWGGSQRMPRRIGVPAAMESILGGKLHPARKALRLGLVDRLAKPAYLGDVAARIAAGTLRCEYRGRRGAKRILVDKNPLATALIAKAARKQVIKKTGGHYPAPLAVIPLVAKAPVTSLEAGLVHERRAVRPLAGSDTARNLIGLFLRSEEAKRLAEAPGGSAGEKAAPFQRAGVIGAGVMGGGIASLMAEKGLEVRLRDLDQGILDAAQVEHQAAVTKKRRRRRLTPAAANAALDRLETTTTGEGFQRCDLVLEAVAERLDVKRTVLGELAARLSDDAVLATNTSSLSVDDIAAELPHSERVVGIHFFNPVRRMPLVEVVRGAATSPMTVARACRLAVDLGKTPVVTADCAGFLVNRVLGPYLDESVRLLEEGVAPERIDAALKGFGMPMGPCELLDEVGLDIAGHAGASLESAYGERMRACRLLRPLVDAGRLGKKTGSGIYVWTKDERGRPQKNGVNPDLGDVGRTEMSSAQIVDRTVLAMVNEAARCLEEGVVAGPAQLDLATVFGTGFAPFRGGVLSYADARGLGEVAERLRELHIATTSTGTERSGRFEPAALLEELASARGRFHDAPGAQQLDSADAGGARHRTAV